MKMKKVFAILLVMALVSGFVFADSEAHELRVKADVTEVLPAFNLYHVAGSDTNSSAVVFTNGADYKDLKTDANATDVNFNLDEAGHFDIVAEVVNNVKTTKGFTLAFTGGVFTVNRNTVSGKYSPSQITVANGDNNAAIKEYGTVSPSDTNESKTTDTTESLTASTTVTFSGKTGSASVANPIKVATATYSYPGDDSIDPTASGSFYFADVKMTVTVI